MASTFSDYSGHLLYKPAGGDVLMARNRHKIANGILGSFPYNEALYAISETYLVEFEWDKAFSIENDTNREATEKFTKTRGLTVTEGSEVSTEFGISAAFKGIGINLGGSRKNFQSTETSVVTSLETTMTCPPNLTTYFFQRLYRFRTRVWYLLDAWSQLSRVGGMPINNQPNYTPTFSECKHEIKSEDYFLTHVAPEGTGTFSGSATSTPPEFEFLWTRQFNNTTQLTQNYLRGLANRGMAYISGFNAKSAQISYSVSSSSKDAEARKKSEGDGADLIGIVHPPDETQDRIVSVTKRTSDAPPDEELPAATGV